MGQYARQMASGTGKIGMRYYNLLTQKQIDKEIKHLKKVKTRRY